LISPQYTAPANVKVFPAGTKPGKSSPDPILSIASVFGVKLEGLAVEWTLATNQFPPDPGYTDLLPTIASEFIPQKWLIERTGHSGGPENVLKPEETSFEDKKGKRIKRSKRLRDESGDYFRVFEKYIIIDPSTQTATFLLGQLGKFRYIDTDVTKDKTYYYRIRAFSGSLDVGSSGTMTLPAPIVNKPSGELIQTWPATDPNDPVIMGRPSGIITGRVPNIPADFDVIAVLNATFRAAFALGFHLEVPAGATFNEDGSPAADDTHVADVGKGLLTNLAGPLGRLFPKLEFGALFGAAPDPGATATNASPTPDPVTGKYPDVTHNFISVKAHASRLTNAVAGSLLENSGMLIPLRDLYQGALPKPIKGDGYLASDQDVTSIEKLVTKFITIQDGFPETYDPKVYKTYAIAFSDLGTRLNIVAAVQFIKSFTLGGVPPDWVSISLLRDIIPFSGQFIYELLARIDALLAAFKSIIDEIAAFIDLLIRKIDVLERFVKFLIDILNYLDSFSAGFFFLSVPATDKGIPGWVEAIDNAGGTRPPSGPGGYSAGIALAYAGPNIDAFSTAFSIIF
jgi:hypothetical protein